VASAYVGAWVIPLGVCLICTAFSPAAPGWRSLPRALSVLLAASLATLGVFAAQSILQNSADVAAASLGKFGGLAVAAGFAAGIGLANRRSLPRAIAGASAAALAALLAPALSDGWLNDLGASASLGHGAIDLSGLAVIGLCGGGAALGGNLAFRGSDNPAPCVPTAHHGFFALFDGAVLLTGMLLWIGTQPGAETGALMNAQLSNLGAAITASVLTAVAYSWFTTSRVSTAMVSHAFTAALFVSGSIALLPTGIAVLAGGLAALCAIPIAYWLKKTTGVRDDGGLYGTLLLPGAAGALLTGLFATGEHLAGWAGVGAGSYMNVAGLGVTGWLTGGDIGQFTAQVIFMLVAAATPLGTAYVVTNVARELAPQRCIDMDTESVSTAVDVPRPQPRPAHETIDGGASAQPRKPLPGARAYRVAYPFRNRGRRPMPDFVVSEETPDRTGSTDTSSDERP
jgi:hypothetical protein